MVSSNYIIEVSEANFEYEVIQYSRNKPVVVDFWAEWCGPCRTLGPMLEELAENAEGRFRLAKVDIDENPNLAIRYNVRSIPYVKGFRMGQAIAEFMGVVPQPEIEKFLRELAPSPTDLTLNKGLSLLQYHRWADAEASLRKVLQEQPKSPGALLGLAKGLLAQNKAKEALELLKNFPSSREYATAEVLRPLADALAQSKPLPGKPGLEAIYLRALNLIKGGNFPAALDGLLELLRQDKNYRNGNVRKIVVAALEILGEESELTRQYRSELASILF
ncbi:MAG TPA: thioredoxin [Anaerolineales bacterium]|jgi:putative thioredoxin|nr:thioredoxin [Anaerolineales bacterium]